MNFKVFVIAMCERVLITCEETNWNYVNLIGSCRVYLGLLHVSILEKTVLFCWFGMLVCWQISLLINLMFVCWKFWEVEEFYCFLWSPHAKQSYCINDEKILNLCESVWKHLGYIWGWFHMSFLEKVGSFH